MGMHRDEFIDWVDVFYFGDDVLVKRNELRVTLKEGRYECRYHHAHRSKLTKGTQEDCGTRFRAHLRSEIRISDDFLDLFRCLGVDTEGFKISLIRYQVT